MFTQLFDCLFPLQCAGCSRYGAPLCVRCAQQPLMRNSDHPPRVFAAFEYHDARVRRLVHRLKYQGEWALARFLADMMIRVLLMESVGVGIQPLHMQNENASGRIPRQRAVLVPVPLYRDRLLERGYNQSEKLARAVGQRMGIPVCNLLERTRATVHQTEMSKAARFANVHGAFRQIRGVDPGVHIILVDDVVTTGATIIACSRSLESQNVSALAFARQTLASVH